MLTVGCAGFAVPATRYFKEYGFVEIQETHRAVPGPGTIRRWRREAPADFRFAVLGPREVAQEGFRPGKVVETALAGLVETAAELDAQTAVFVANPDFGPTRPNKAALRDFLKLAKAKFSVVVFEPGLGWDADDADALAEETDTLAARDPLQHGPSKRKIAYYRLPGPAGHKSRYEDPAIERLAEIAHEAKNDDAHYVFANVDMFADAKRFKKAYGM
ncbi:MAG TPA: DUF72 domain-containing protein [Polyangiaceae bacterium]|nr:DUF72 domain-containing protein [Polyangiaceae bacterium]